MSKDLNNFTCSGRLGRDLDLKQVGEHQLATGVLAISDGYGDREETIWLPIEIWGKRAETAAQYLAKGSRVGLSGKLGFEQWETQAGDKRSKHKLKVSDWIFLDAKTSDNQRQDTGGPTTTRNAHERHGEGRTPEVADVAPEDDDDIPF